MKKMLSILLIVLSLSGTLSAHQETEQELQECTKLLVEGVDIIKEQELKLNELKEAYKVHEEEIEETKKWYNSKFLYLSIGLVFGVII